MRNTPGLTACCNPRLSLADQSRNREKLAEEKGLFDSGWGLWSSVAAQTHTYMFIKLLTHLHKHKMDILQNITYYKIMNIHSCMFTTEAHSALIADEFVSISL